MIDIDKQREDSRTTLSTTAFSYLSTPSPCRAPKLAASRPGRWRLLTTTMSEQVLRGAQPTSSGQIFGLRCSN
jgi:hypothetical protein